MSPASDFRHYLKEELARRCRANPRYSQRAFARDLKISPALLNEVIQGKHGLSPERALSIAEQLGLNKVEREHFLDSVESKHARKGSNRKRAEQKISLQREFLDAKVLEDDRMAAITDWYPMAILEATVLEGFSAEPTDIAKRLELPLTTVDNAIERLERLGLAERVGKKIRAMENFTFTTDGIPSASIRAHHGQILDRAKRALELQTVNERYASSVTVAIDQTQLADARKDLQKFKREFLKKYGAAQKKTDVFCLALHFFNLTPGSSS